VKKYEIKGREVGGIIRAEFPPISIGKGESFTVKFNTNTKRGWVKKNGIFLTLLLESLRRVWHNHCIF